MLVNIHKFSDVEETKQQKKKNDFKKSPFSLVLPKLACIPMCYTLLKSDITRYDHMSVVNGYVVCGSRFVNFIVNFIPEAHTFHMTLKTVKSTTFEHMLSWNA